MVVCNEKGCKKRNEKMKQYFHTTTTKGFFLCKRARPEIKTAIAFLINFLNNLMKMIEKLIKINDIFNGTK